MYKLKFLALLLFGLIICFAAFEKLTDVQAQGEDLLGPPTGFSASIGSYTTKVGLNWDPIRGATAYRIFRNTTNDSSTATALGTTAAPYFFDSTANPNVTFFYWVRAENSTEQSVMSASANGLRAVGTPNGPVPPLEPPPAPAGNPVTGAKVALGKALFWDEQLSTTRTVSCGTCHINGKGGSDPRSIVTDLASTSPGPNGIFGDADDIIASPGVPLNNLSGQYLWSVPKGIDPQVTTRKTNSSINAAYSPELFWDGRATTVFRDPITNAVVLNSGAALESQAAGPPVSGVEMGHTTSNWTETALQIQNSKPLALSPQMPAGLETWIGGRSYPDLFTEAFGSSAVTPARIAMAIATYERTLFSDRAPIDLSNGGAANVFTAAEQRGRIVFNGANCNACHGGPTMTNDLYLYIGVRPQGDDLGRFDVTGLNNDRGQMKVPSLRNVELRTPLMHNGRFQTLGDVAAFYNRGGDFDAPNKAPGIIPRGLNAQQLSDLAAFLGRPLTDPRVANETGPFSRPTQYTESSRVPTVSGTGRAGNGGNVPEAVAIQPPIAGNPKFTIGLSNALPNQNAVLVLNSTDPGISTSIPAAGSFARQTIQTTDNGTGIGYGSVTLAIPTTPNVVGQTFFGRWYVTDGAAANGFSVSRLIRFTVFGGATAPAGNTRFDFDGDSKSDLSIFRPSNGQWWYLRSSDFGNRGFSFGLSTDKLVPADYTGDGKTDIAFFRNGEWFVLRSEDNSFYSVPFGTSGDIPAPGDFDGDGKVDTAIYRPASGLWVIQNSSGGTVFQAFGLPEDKPVVEDYDGDGKDDIAIFRPSSSQWWQMRSTAGTIGYQFGATGDKTVQGDYTGDGKADVALFRPSNGSWYILRSENSSFYSVPFGNSTDIPTAGDYDGDGKTDTAVFRPLDNFWYVQGSTSGFFQIGFGQSGDTPVPAAYIAP